MDEKLAKKLFKKFKFLKKKEIKTIDIKDGWANIVSDMCQKLSAFNLPKDFAVIKIFSKIDELKVYTKCGVNGTRFIIDEAVEQSVMVCEDCGNNKELQMCTKCKDAEADVTYDPLAALAAQVPVDPNAARPVVPIPAGGNTVGANGIALSSVPADYYFKLEYDPNQTLLPQYTFIITPRVYWDANKYWYDDMPGIELVLYNNGFDRLEESLFEYSGNEQAGRTLLIALGFVENNNM